VRRLLLLGAVLVAAVVVQSTVLARVRVGGVRPDLLVLAVVSVAVASEATAGAAFGFLAGLVADLLFDLPVGVSALVYTAVGFAVGAARVYLTGHRPLGHLALAGAASLAAAWSCGLLLRVFDLSSWGAVARAGPLVALCNLALAPLLYPLVWALTERVPARPARRW
jgi:rod shape-determining protein MreD